MKALSAEEIFSYLTLHLPDWKYTGNAIKRDFTFKSFVEAFSFMSAIALHAEKMDHHPDWNNAYNTVSISLYTHSAKGITTLDFDLAGKINSVYSKFADH